MITPQIRFQRKDETGFFRELKTRIDNYFEENKITKTGGSRMVWKAIGMLSVYLIPYVLILTGWFGPWSMLLLSILMGAGLAGVGMSVMHDACHGAFSEKRWVNKLFARSMYLVGGNVYNWKIQHNTLHHTFTNVHHADEDIAGKAFLRLDRNDPLKPSHRYQHWYALALYSLMTFAFHVKDFRQVWNWGRDTSSKVFYKEFSLLVLGKLFFFAFMFIPPILLLNIPFWQILIGFTVVNLTAGFILAVVFQLAHIVEEAQQFKAENGQLENIFAVHQLETTANFSPKSRFLTWYLGGLNFQVEHHLFPNICHLHYKHIAPIVERTAREFQVAYNIHPTFGSALGSHMRQLKRLGTQE